MTAPQLLTKVFLALRTDFFGEAVEDEHITLKYFHGATLNEIVDYADSVDRYVPTEIKLNGFANWEAAGMFYEVALVDAFKNPALFTGVRTPHITIRKSSHPVSNATFEPRYYGDTVQILDRLWIGKKIKGKIRWMQHSNRGIGEIRTDWTELVAS